MSKGELNRDARVLPIDAAGDTCGKRKAVGLVGYVFDAGCESEIDVAGEHRALVGIGMVEELAKTINETDENRWLCGARLPYLIESRVNDSVETTQGDQEAFGTVFITPSRLG
jgi:hypothetical protein